MSGALASCLELPARLTANGPASRLQGTDALGQCILEILRTPIGARPLLPEFGSMLRLRRYQPNDELLEGLVRDDVVEAVRRWEPRVKVERVVCTRAGLTLSLKVWFRVLALGPNGPLSFVEDTLALG